MEYLKLVELYEQGDITGLEFTRSILALVTEKNVVEILGAIPDELKDHVVKRAQQLEGVGSVKTFCIESVVYANGFDKEAHQKRMADESLKFLRGAEIVRHQIQKYLKQGAKDGNNTR